MRCLRCRDRKTKVNPSSNCNTHMLIRLECVYTSEDMPCEFCRTHKFRGCIKITAQKVPLKVLRRHLDIQRLAMNDIDTNSSSSPTANLGLTSLLSQFKRRFASDAGIVVWDHSEICRIFTVAALAARRRTTVEYTEHASSYEAKAVDFLSSAIEQGIEREVHVFTANIIGWLAYSSCSDTVNAPLHFKGSYAILDSLLHHRLPFPGRHNLPQKELLIVFGPFIIDCAAAWSVRAGVIPCRNTNFSQRTQYFDHFSRLDNSGTWYSGILEAANSTLGNALEVALNCVCETINKEIALDLKRESVAHALLYIRSELGDVDLQSALWQLYESFQESNTDHSTVEGQLITRIFHRMRIVLLLESVLEAASVENGVLDAKTNAIAQTVILFCRHQTSERDPNRIIEDYFLMSWHNFSHLLLGGMSLSRADTPDRSAPF